MSRLRLGASEVQARLLPKASMPKPALEKDLVYAIRAAFDKLGIWNESGRIAVFGRGKVRYLPVLGPGTPDLLCWTSTGRMFGIEAKRDTDSKERDSQREWREAARVRGVIVRTCRSVREAFDAWEEAKR